MSYHFVNENLGILAMEDWELISTDTDSFYMSISSEELEDLVMPHMRREYEMDKCNFLVTRPEDNRVTGLFKMECELRLTMLSLDSMNIVNFQGVGRVCASSNPRPTAASPR